MRSAPLRTVALLVAFLLTGRLASAEGILDQLPADATWFVAIHNLAGTSAKIERVTAIFKELTPGPLPAPLAIAQGITGIGPGLNESGDALLALMPGEDSPFAMRPFFLLPVSDYAALAESIGGDTTGEICRVTIAGEEVLLAKRGDFAALMNVEHRDHLTKILAAEPAPPAELASLAKWLATTDVSAGLTRSGVERLVAFGRRSVADFRQQMEANFADPGMADLLFQVQQNIQMYDTLMEFLGAEVKAGAIGLTIDDASNVRLAKRLLISPTAAASPLANAKPLEKTPLEGFASEPYVLAGSGPFLERRGEAIAASIRELLEQIPQGQGYKGFDEQDWQKLEQSYQELFKGLKSLAFVLYEGGKEEGVLSNYYFECEVDDSSAYLQQFRKSLELQNELMESADNDLAMPYEIKDVDFDGKAAIEATADVAAAGADPNVAMVEPMLKAMFGADGKMRMYAVAVDADTVLVGVAPKASVAKAVEFAASGKEGLSTDAAIGVTTKLFDPQAPWTALVSPAGATAWGTRAFQAMTMAFGGGEAKTPPFPQTAPLGISLNLTSDQLQAELIVPVDVLEGAATYAEKLNKGE